jgi:hypothetical protein
MSDTMHVDPVTLVILTALFSGAIGGMFPAFWSAIINRGVEQEKRLAALKTKVKRLLREEAANPGSQKFEDLADELDELAQLKFEHKRRKRTKNNQEVTSFDLLEAADMLRQAGSVAQGDDRLEPRELIGKLRIRLSPQEEQRFPARCRV